MSQERENAKPVGGDGGGGGAGKAAPAQVGVAIAGVPRG